VIDHLVTYTEVTTSMSMLDVIKLYDAANAVFDARASVSGSTSGKREATAEDYDDPNDIK